jgi:hypothetical protein
MRELIPAIDSMLSSVPKELSKDDIFSREYMAETYRKIGESLLREQSEEMLAFIEHVQNSGYESLIFLDKSARPGLWLMSELWAQLCPEIPKPDIKFLNVGREKFNSSFAGVYSPPEDHEVFIQGMQDNTDLVTSVKSVLTGWNSGAGYLDGKNICIVDECSPEGGSLIAAKALVEAALGEKVASIDTHTIFSFEPFWLSQDDLIGVKDIDNQTTYSTVYRPIKASLELRKFIKLWAETIAKNTIDTTIQ